MPDTLAFRCPSCGGVNRVAPDRLGSAPVCGRCKTALDLAAHPQAVTDDELERLVKSAPVPILADFWAAWCGPCRAVAPHLEALARKHAGKLLVVKVDTDQHQRTAQALGVRGIPTLAVWRGGKLEISQAGALMGPQLDAFVAPYLT